MGSTTRWSRRGALRPQLAGLRALTSREICQRALQAHEHLFRLVGCDEPDLGAGVSFVLGAARLRRIASAEPWVVEPAIGGPIVALIEAAEGVVDARMADSRFLEFAEVVLARLERRSPGRAPRADQPERRLGNHARAPERADRPGLGSAALA